jgi:DMSO/TMAO reductase YedYZ heme-binding membrane subunit
VAGGIVAAWLMLVLAFSFNVRRRIGQRRWRLMHYATFGAFAIGLYHALNVGSDLTGSRGLIFAGIFAAPVVWLVFARILMPRAKARQAPAPPPPAPPTLSALAARPRSEADRAAVTT